MCFSPSATAKRTCPECGKKQDVDNKVCSKCGYEFPENIKKRRERACPECGAMQAMTNRKCSECGALIKAGGARKGPSGPSGPSGPR